MRLLVVDACDSMSRMSDLVMGVAGNGISGHLEEIIMSADDERLDDLVASCLVVVLAILNPLAEQMLASTSGRNKRGDIADEDRPFDNFTVSIDED